MENEDKVSVIIPAYNNEIYLPQCIESVLNQTYSNYEIIIINDGSEDDTLYVAKQYEQKYNCIKVIDNENKGQGFSRNYALKFAQGDYILFLDSDDFIEPVTLEVAVNRIKVDQSDLVVFDWKYYKINSKNYLYVNKDTFYNKKVLIGEECLDLLTIKHYFTVNKLYSKNFLKKNNIKYSEGHIYEDNPFWVKVCIKAKKVSLIHSPLYNVRISTTSSTKTNNNTDFHYISYIKAVREIMSIVGNRKKEQYYYLYKYLIQKFWVYYNRRTPKEYRKRFISEFVDAMSISRLKNYNVSNTLVRLIYKLKIFEKKRKKLFKLLYHLYKLKKKYKKMIKNTKLKAKKIYSCKLKKVINQNLMYWEKYKSSIPKEIILFMGFDFRYTGNSRYLFEKIITKKTDNIFFVTEDEKVDSRYRIKPYSEEFYKAFYTAQIVIFESWIPEKLKKTQKSIWIQLWHGTPLKKMLFDSDEKEIISNRLNHKIVKFNDIRRWDYLLTDNENINKYFERAFLISNKKILPLGYPRVEYLIDNRNNIELKKRIKDKANLPDNKKIVTYLPTWRDYNYGVDKKDIKSDYFLNGNELKKYLGDEYVIISKNHVYLDNNSEITNIDLETQELLLISDYLITDYSSVMFDAFPIDLPVILLTKDYEEYIESRGVYSEIWDLMKNILCKTEKEVSYMIKNYKFDTNYKYIKENLCYKNDRRDKLDKLIFDIIKRKGKLIRSVLIFGEFNKIDKIVIDKIKLANKLGNRVILGIITCKENKNCGFKEKKEIMEQLKGVDLVIPISEDNPTQKEIKEYQIDIIITDKNNDNNYNFDVEYIE